jgi:magnesium chelatase subunit I
MLYVDEVNLLDDHLVNIILDAASTNVLNVHRDYADRPPEVVRFALVGTMNPDEGWLRPQLFDRFGLVVHDVAEATLEHRRLVLERVLRYDEERDDPGSAFMAQAHHADAARRAGLEAARDACGDVLVGPEVVAAAARLADEFRVEGHRGEVTLVRAARALAALQWALEAAPPPVNASPPAAADTASSAADTASSAADTASSAADTASSAAGAVPGRSVAVTLEHLRAVAKPALVHRRPHGEAGVPGAWDEPEIERVAKALDDET